MKKTADLFIDTEEINNPFTAFIDNVVKSGFKNFKMSYEEGEGTRRGGKERGG